MWQWDGDRPGLIQEEFIQQSLDLAGLSSSPSSSPVRSHNASWQTAASGEQIDALSESVGVVLKAIEAEIARLNWVPVQESIWISQHFRGRTRSELRAEELTPPIFVVSL